MSCQHLLVQSQNTKTFEAKLHLVKQEIGSHFDSIVFNGHDF